MAKPCSLTLGVLRRRALGPQRSLIKPDLSPDVGGQFAHPKRAHSGKGRIEAQRQQRAHLLDSASLEHRPEAGRDRRAQGLAGRVQQNRSEPPGRRLARLGLPFRKPPAGASPDFPAARNALTVGRTEPAGCNGILCGKPRMQAGRAELREQGSSFRPHFGAWLWDIGNPLGKRSEVQAGSAAQDWDPPGGVRLLHRCAGCLPPKGRTSRIRGGPDAVQAMRHARLLGRRRPSGEDAQLAINLHRICVDDFPGQPHRKIQG